MTLQQVKTLTDKWDRFGVSIYQWIWLTILKPKAPFKTMQFTEEESKRWALIVKLWTCHFMREFIRVRYKCLVLAEKSKHFG